MIKLETIQFIQSLISYLVAYFPTVILSGYFTTWINYKLGDSTAKNAGFLTFNPITHIDPIGITILIFQPHYGFGSFIPDNINNIKEPFKNIKTFLLFFGRTIIHIIMLFISIFCFIGLHYIVSKLGIITGDKTLLKSSENYSFFLSLNLILFAFLNLNILSIIVSSISALSRLIVHAFLPDIEERSDLMNFLVFLLPLIMIIVIGPYIQLLLIKIITG